MTWESCETSLFLVQLTRRTGMLCILSTLGHMGRQWDLETVESVEACVCRGHVPGQAPRHLLPMSRRPAGGFQEGRRTHRKERARDESSTLTEAWVVSSGRLSVLISLSHCSRICPVRLSDQTPSPRTLLTPHIRRALGLPGALSCCPAICEYP